MARGIHAHASDGRGELRVHSPAFIPLLSTARCTTTMQDHEVIPLNYVYLRSLRTLNDTVNCLQFDTDATYLAVGCDNGQFVVFKVDEDGDPEAMFRSPNGSAVTALLWNPAKSASIFIGYSDGTILVFQLTPPNASVSTVQSKVHISCTFNVALGQERHGTAGLWIIRSSRSVCVCRTYVYVCRDHRAASSVLTGHGGRYV